MPNQELLERLEGKWKSPPDLQDSPSEKIREWCPLPDDYPDWKPLGESWEMDKALKETRNNGERVEPLSDECKDQLRNYWDQTPYLPACDAGHHNLGGGQPHFHCYPIPNVRRNGVDWQQWRGLCSSPLTSPNIWWCSNLMNAAQHYSWRSYNGGTFVQLAAALQSAMRHNNHILVRVVCLKILDWGGVRHRSKNTVNWLAATADNHLIPLLLGATSNLCPQSTASLNNFGLLYPMNSGSTKIFSAVAMDFSGGYDAPKQDVIIFDRRVSAGLGLLARNIFCPNPVPNLFRFPHAGGRRDPSCPHTTFNSMDSTKITDIVRAEYARTAARCIQQTFGTYLPSADFVRAEKAIFMIGYDVRTMCCGCARPCP